MRCRFFEDYKKNEHKEVIVDKFLGREEALRITREAMVSAGAPCLHALHQGICR